MNTNTILIGVLVIVGIIFGLTLFTRESFPLPRGETTRLLDSTTEEETEVAVVEEEKVDTKILPRRSQREIFVTDGTKHSIPLSEILSGGPGKDGIPSIDEPKFLTLKEAETFLEETDPGIGLVVNGESRFYPYRILVWHEIVNDSVGGKPVLITYCPLCATGIVFERKVGSKEQEFGVSGLLWQSNLLMYNRVGNEENESLWSQVLGEAVLGPDTGIKLTIVPSDIILFGDWKRLYPNTKVLSQNTGNVRDYGRDPYGNYYSSESVSFGAQFNDKRLHPKTLVVGIEINGTFKAYNVSALPGGDTQDVFAGTALTVSKGDAGRITIATENGDPIPYIPGFWFSWLAVHPNTELFK